MSIVRNKGETCVKGRSIAFFLAAVLCLCGAAGCAGEGEPQTHRHEIIYVEERRPTCTEAGMEGYWICRICGATFSDEGGKEPCEPEAFPAEGHDFFREALKAATCEEAGRIRLVCTKCGYEEEETDPAKGHIWGPWLTTRAPSCLEAGEETRFCANCREQETHSIPASGQHKFGTDNVCTACAFVCEPTPGLSYAPVTGEDGNLAGYAVSLGTAEASQIVVAPYYEGEPVIAVAEKGFCDCNGIKTFTSYALLVRIGAEAFRGCTGLRAVELADSVEEVGEMAFYACSKVVSLRLGSGTERIASNAFYGLQALESITVSEENLAYSGEGNCLVERKSGKLILGCGSSVIPDGVREICDYAFHNNCLISCVEVPSSVVRIGTSAFDGCKELTSFTYLGTAEEWERVEKGARWRDYAPFGEVRFGA